jgi:phage terminase large subunit-like protein
MPMTYDWRSLRASLEKLSKEDIVELFADFDQEQLLEIRHEWRLWARDNQLPPDEPTGWPVWLVLAGRGFGKTRSGAEFVCAEVDAGRAIRVAVVAPTASDARDVMVEGESGIIAIAHPKRRPDYEPSKRRLTWPNGAIGTLYSAEEPNRLRGPQHDLAWADELAAWSYMREAWDNLMLGLRLGKHPRCMVTTTGKPRRLLAELVNDPANAVTRGSTYENKDNLAPSFLRTVRRKYEGTRLGRQELLGELLLDVPGALWNRDLVEKGRVPKAPKLDRIVIAIDPAVTKNATSNETGIVAAGTARGPDGTRHLYVLRDLSGRLDAGEWSRRAVGAYKELEADRIVGEVNNGGDLIEAQIRVIDRNVPYRSVHATRGKRKRAEPVAALSEQGRLHLVGSFPELEDQMCAYLPIAEDEDDDAESLSEAVAADRDERMIDETGAPVGPTFAGGSPDRVDALVWSAFDLIIEYEDRNLDFSKVPVIRR